MLLLEPEGNAFAGGEIALKFESPAAAVTARLDGQPIPVLSDGARITLSLNGAPVDQWMSITGDVRDTRGTVTPWSLRVVKPRHDLAGLGATYLPQKGGSFFKVWLPGPSRVFVRGDFNGWTDKHQLDQLGTSGYWYGFVRDATPTQQYKYYAYLPGEADGNGHEVPDPAARNTFSAAQGGPDKYDANALICDRDGFTWQYDGWWADRRRRHDAHILYQAHWGTFFRPDSAGTEYEGFAVGTTEQEQRESVQHKLQRVVDLGFTTLALLPVQESNGSTDGGYDPSFYWSFEAACGGRNPLRVLIDEAHHLGLAVIFDVVYNHVTADKGHASLCHPLLIGSYIKQDAPWSNDRLWPGQSDWGPDPDILRGEVQRFFIDNAAMLFDEMHVDGLRFDATKCFPSDGLRAIVGELRRRYDGQGKYLIAEHLDPAPFQYAVDDIGFHASWYDDTFNKTIAALDNGDIGAVETAFLTCASGDRPTTALKYGTGSHDKIWRSYGGQSTVARFGGPDNWYARAKLRLAWMLTATAPGTPMMFMGTEVHAPMPWDDYRGYSGHNDRWSGPSLDWTPPVDSPGGQMARLVQETNTLRLREGALRHGHSWCVHRDWHNHIIAFKRWDGDGSVVLVIFNMSDNQWERREYCVQTGTPNSRWREVLSSQWWQFGGWAGAGNEDPFFHPTAGPDGMLQGVNLPKWSASVFKQEL